MSTRTDPGPPDGRLHVIVVCSGNICRSPIAEQMLRAALEDAGLASAVRVSSAGTGSWHVGSPAHPAARNALRRAGFPTDHRARKITADELTGADLVLAADRGHLRFLTAMGGDPVRVRLLRGFDPAAVATGDPAETDVPDPYGGPDSEFDDVVTMTAAAVPGVLQEIRRLLAAPLSGADR